MITVKIGGGLGNQMFQYAFGRAFSLRRGTELRVDPSTLFDITPRKWRTPRNYGLDIVFAIEPKLNWPARVTRILRIPYVATVFNKYYPMVLGKMGYWRYVNYMDDAHSGFDPSVLKLTGDLYCEGYWISERYFKDYEAEIRKDFRFRHELEGKTAKIGNDIKACNSVCLQVRRGDNIWNPVSQKVHILAPMSHYERAVASMKEKVGKDIRIYVFSDDMPWCRENLRLDAEVEFVGEEHAGVEQRDHLQLMSFCRHFILPQSTFGWWAAWLSANKDKVVIVPEVLYKKETIDTKDMIPETWIRM